MIPGMHSRPRVKILAAMARKYFTNCEIISQMGVSTRYREIEVKETEVTDD